MPFFDKYFKKKKVRSRPDSNTGRANDTMNMVQKTMDEQNQRYQEVANGIKRTEPVADNELLKCFAEYFAPNKEFFLTPDSPKFQAYFNAINAAKLEMLNQPNLYKEATGRTTEMLLNSINNPMPGISNMLICGQIFYMGRYAVIKDKIYCVDFLEQLPNCIALYLLLIAQKETTDKRIQLLDTGDGVNPAALKTVTESLKVLDPSWQPKFFGSY